MQFLSNIRIGQRLTAGFAVVIVCLMAMMGVGYGAIQTLNAEISQLIRGDCKAVQANQLARAASTVAGGGGAVVASEVRSLAGRSAEAATEIKRLISDSVQKVMLGNELAAMAATTMQGVVANMQRMTDIMGEISHASAEQSTGIERVTHTIHAMDRSTQRNAALVEEAATNSLRAQAHGLGEVVSLFKR